MGIPIGIETKPNNGPSSCVSGMIPSNVDGFCSNLVHWKDLTQEIKFYNIERISVCISGALYPEGPLSKTGQTVVKMKLK